MGIWKVRGINGKEVELVQQIKTMNPEIIGMTEIQQKEYGRKSIHKVDSIW